jgi:hypothetical protein
VHYNKRIVVVVVDDSFCNMIMIFPAKVWLETQTFLGGIKLACNEEKEEASQIMLQSGHDGIEGTA